MHPLRLLVLFLSLLAGLRAADAIQMAGVISIGPGKTLVRLVNATTGIASWVSVGDTFAGYRVQSYTPSPDGRSDFVTLTGNGAPLRLTLATSKVRSSNARGGTAAVTTPANTASVGPNTPMVPGNAESVVIQAAPPPPPAPPGN
jgi:hypothetical protein